jgi:hypothetical protein
VISGFSPEVAENCALLGYYAVSRGNFLPRTTTSCIITQKRAVLTSKVHCIMKMKAVCLLQNDNCLPMWLNIPEDMKLLFISLYSCVQNTFHFNKYVKGKGKAVPLQAWSGLEGSRKLRFPDFLTTTQYGGEVSPTHQPPLPAGNTPGTHFCLRLSLPQGHSAIGGIVNGNIQ